MTPVYASLIASVFVIFILSGCAVKMTHDATEEFLARYYYNYKSHRWNQWYAWRPVRDIYGKWHWRENLYRMVGNTYVDHDDWTWYFYLTERDMTLFLLKWS
jgi:hypothetical protein